MILFEVLKIRNGWNIKGTWVDPGGADIAPQPRTETLYCREINDIANVMVAWADKGFEAAYQALQEILRLKEAH